MKRYKLSISILAVSLGTFLFADPAADPAARGAIRQLASMPLGFEPNRGQIPADIDYVYSGFSASIALRATGATLAVAPARDGQVARLEMQLRGVRQSSQPEASGKLDGSQSYYIGSDPSKWLTGVPKFAKIRYREIWRGIDVVYYGDGGRFEYDFIVQPGASPSAVRLRFSGADSISIGSAGDLLIRTPAGLVTQYRPEIYQQVDGKRVQVPGRYLLARSGEVRFDVARYDRARPLIIDPVLQYSDARLVNAINANGIAVDKASGTAYIVGAALPPSMGMHIQGFLYTISPTGSISGFTLGGTNGDTIIYAAALDASDNVYIAGSTTASNLTQGGFQPTYGDAVGSGNTDGFMAKFTKPGANGVSSPLYSTYIGGAGNDGANAIAVDASGFAYVAGTTAAANFPRTEGPTFRAAGTAAFLVKIDPTFPNASDQRSLVYARYIGGTGTDTGKAVALDGVFPIVGGSTTSSSASFSPSTATGFNPTKTAATADGFIVKLDNTGATASYLTFSPSSPVNALAADPGNSSVVYATGQTDGTANALATTPSGYQLAPGGNGCAAFSVAQCADAYLQKYNTAANGSGSLLYGSYLGGALVDIGLAVAAGPNGVAYVAGQTNSSNFPVALPIEGSYQGGGIINASTLANQSDGFLSKINTNGSGVPSLLYSTYLGGSDADLAQGVAIDNANAVYVVGSSASPDFPTAPGPQMTGTGIGAFVLKVVDASPSAVTARYDINGDAREDIVVYFPGNGYQFALLSEGNGSYSPVPTPGISPAFDTLLQGDFNGDLLSDLAYYNTATGDFKAGIGNSTGRFTFAPNITITPGYNVIERGDFNGDGKTDLVFYRKSDGLTTFAISNGDGTFHFVNQSYSPGFTSIAVGDYNGDGKSDIILYNNHDSPFNAYYGIGDGAGNFTFTGLFLGGGFEIHAADINKDGKTDFVMYRPSDGTTYFAISNGTGFAYTYQLYSPGFTAFLIGDVNGDGFPDLVLYNANNTNGYLGLGNGTPNFNFVSSLFFGPNFDFVQLRDVNGDGKKDVVIYRASDGTSYTGISTGTNFSYTYNLFGPGRILAR